MKAIVKTDFNLPGQVGKYVGKVRDVYDIDGKYLVMVVTDRISAFDVVLPEGVPYKGQVLNRIAAKFLDATADILPNWKVAVRIRLSPSATSVSLSRLRWSSAATSPDMPGGSTRLERERSAVWRCRTGW